jgi:hypothetical protein
VVPHSNHSVLALNVDVNIRGQDFRQAGGNSNAKIHTHPIFDLFGSTSRYLVSDVFLIVDVQVGIVESKPIFVHRTVSDFPLYFNVINNGQPFDHAL